MQTTVKSGECKPVSFSDLNEGHSLQGRFRQEKIYAKRENRRNAHLTSRGRRVKAKENEKRLDKKTGSKWSSDDNRKKERRTKQRRTKVGRDWVAEEGENIEPLVGDNNTITDRQDQ